MKSQYLSINKNVNGSFHPAAAWWHCFQRPLWWIRSFKFTELFFMMFLWIFKKKKVRAKMFFSFCLIFFSVDEYSFAHYTTTGVGCVYYHLYYTTKLILKYVKWTVHFNVLYCSHTRVVSALGGQPNPVRNVNWKGLEILKM